MNYGFVIALYKSIKDIRESGKRQEDADAATSQAESDLIAAQQQYQESLAASQQAAKDARSANELLLAEKQANADQYTLEALKRKYEKDKRESLGLYDDTLDKLGNTKQALLDEEIENIENALDTEGQQGVADLKFPLKTSIALVAIAGGIYYYRRK